MTPPLPLDEAQRRLLALVRPLGPERMAAREGIGRYLWSGLAARRTQPAADLSAMDGYAVSGDAPWRIVGESAAGRPFGGKLESGEAVRISTGALMPHESQAVLLQEEAERQGERLAVAPDGEPSPRHIRRRGFDFAEGDPVLEAGLRIGPAQLALAITAGHGDRIEVGRLPRVAVIDSGDELAAEIEAWADHRLPASNGAMIAALAAPFAAAVEPLGPVPDRMDALADVLARAEGADVVVTTGGASVGDHDLVRPALEAWGAQIDFWRVAMKPGKPLLVARRGDTFVLGLPGNPVSSYVTAFLFLLPLLRALGGSHDPLPRTLQLKLAEPLPAGGNRLELLRAHHAAGLVGPVGEQDSSALRALAVSNALIRREIDAPPAERGDLVATYLLDNGGTA
jgi:molybdopterin molybdotransferase